MNRTLRSVLALLAVLAVVVFAARARVLPFAPAGGQDVRTGETSSHSGAGPRVERAPDSDRARIGFRTRELLERHFEKHGREFGNISQAQYLEMAQALRDQAAGAHVIEVVRSDRVITRFDRRTKAFLACESDGTIRTFFRPNDGEAYFWRQARRGREHS